jgi:altronate dehydratase large subunit
MNFMGYERPDGRAGSRNHVAVIPGVVCANDVAQEICRRVDNCRGYFHHQGCCQLPPDLDRVTQCLTGLALSGNVGAALIVSLGCEGTDCQKIYDAVVASGKPAEIIRIQELGGMANSISEGIKAAQRLSSAISPQQRVPIDISRLTLSIKCGASDATSGLASNCVIGCVADRLVDLGATVVFGETTEFIGAEHILARRAATPEAGREILRIVGEMENRAKSLGCDMRKGQPTPGNIAGGLSSIEEKSLGAIIKSGSRPIEGVLRYEEMVTVQKGLWIKDSPGREPEILTGMAVTGAQAMLFSTGRGAPQGFPTMPVIKICGNPITYEHMINDMDLNAGRIITGEASIDEVGEEAFDLLLEVLSGRTTKNEAVGYFGSIDICPIGPVI